MHVAFCLVNFQECERTTKSRKKNSSRVSGSDNGKPDRRSNGFRRWKAESQEYRVRTMESWIAGATGSDDGKLDRRSIRFGQWKAESQKYRVQTMESWIAGVSDSDDGKPESSESKEGALNQIVKPEGKYLYLRVSCYFDVNYVKHNLHQSGGKLLTLDFCP